MTSSPEKKSWQRATLPRAIPAVPSPLEPFTSVFGMGTGVATPPWPPGKKHTEEIDLSVSTRNRTGFMAPKRKI